MRIQARSAPVRHHLYLAIAFVRSVERERRRRPSRKRMLLAAARKLTGWAREAEIVASLDALVLYEAALAARRAGEGTA